MPKNNPVNGVSAMSNAHLSLKDVIEVLRSPIMLPATSLVRDLQGASAKEGFLFTEPLTSSCFRADIMAETIVDRLTREYNADMLQQPGVTVVVDPHVEINFNDFVESAVVYNGRVSGDSFKGGSKMPRKAYYFAIYVLADLDIKKDGKKVPFSDIDPTLVARMEEGINSVYATKNSVGWFRTNSGFRFIIRANPVQVFWEGVAKEQADEAIPLVSNKIHKMAVDKFVEDELSPLLAFFPQGEGWDCKFDASGNSATNSVGLSRLAKVVRSTADLRSTVVHINNDFNFVADIPTYLTKVANQTSPARPAIATRIAKPSLAKQDSAEYVEFLYNQAKNCKLVDYLVEQGTRPEYESWRGLIDQYGKLALQYSDSRFKDLAIEVSSQLGSDGKEEEFLEANYSKTTSRKDYGAIHMSTFLNGWHNDLPEDIVNYISCNGKYTDLARSLSGVWHYYATQECGKTTGKHPFTGNVWEAPKIREEEDSKAKVLTTILGEKILLTDTLLQQIIYFDVMSSEVCVHPNFANILDDNGSTNLVRDVWSFKWMTDADTQALIGYLIRVYNIRENTSKDIIHANLLSHIRGCARRKFRKYHVHKVIHALRSRHAAYKATKGVEVLGTTNYLENWLPLILGIDPTLNAETAAAYAEYGSKGASMLKALVCRAMAFDNPEKLEALFIFLGNSGGTGKTELAKAIICGLFGIATTDVKAQKINNKLCHIVDSSVAEDDKENIINSLGKLIMLQDEMSKNNLKEEGAKKRDISKAADIYTPKFSNTAVEVNRTYIQMATSNHRHIVNDLTGGNRRNIIIDLDRADSEGFYVCQLIDKTDLDTRLRRPVVSQGNTGFINHSSEEGNLLISMAIGEAFARCCMGEDMPTVVKTSKGNNWHISKRTRQYPQMDEVGMIDPSLPSITAERHELHPDDIEVLQERMDEYQLHGGDEAVDNLIWTYVYGNDYSGLSQSTGFFRLDDVQAWFTDVKKNKLQTQKFSAWVESFNAQNIVVDGSSVRLEKVRKGQIRGYQFMVDGKPANYNPIHKLDTFTDKTIAFPGSQAKAFR